MIPKNIIHIWPGSDLFRYPEWRMSWMKYHPDWTFYFFRLDNLPFNKLLDSTKEIINNNHISYIIKSDILRLDIIRILGGIFVCSDMECMCSFNEFLKHSSFCGIGVKKPCNALFGAEPENELITNAAITVGKNVLFNIEQACSSYDGIMESTGSRAIRPFLEDMEKVYDSYFFYKKETNKKSYSIHHWTNGRPGGWTWLLKNVLINKEVI